MLESTAKQFLDSLLNHGTRHVLCLNISEPTFDATKTAVDYLTEKGKTVTHVHEPDAHAFKAMLADISGKTIVASFDDFDKFPRHIDILAVHVLSPHPKGLLVVVSRQWNADNTAKERELRKSCLFYQQNQPKK
jgi:hypothetical protein